MSPPIALPSISGGLTAKGSARLREDTIDAATSGALADVKPLAPQASGAVAVSITARAFPVAPHVNATLTSNRLAFGQHAIDGLDLRATGKVDPANPQALVSLKGSLQVRSLKPKAVCRDDRWEAGGSRPDPLARS